jgi:YidC/Oxa1 family membrane protein insertase
VHLLGNVPVIQPLIDFFEAILKIFHDKVGLGWGFSIIALTILVRAILLPLTFKQFHSMQRLAHLQPEMKKLQERFKGDKERMNQEMMKFYRENKVNPFASCLPMVAQFPVFISLYYMLRTDLRRDICPEINGDHTPNFAHPIPCGPTGESKFLFIHDLTSKATGSTLIILIVLYVGTQLFSTLLMSTTTDKTQRMIFLALPFIFVTFVIQFPAGLLVYWITTNTWTIVQQAIIRKRLGPLRPAMADAGGGGLFGGAGGLFGGGGGGGSSSPSNGPKSGGGDGGGKPAPRVKETAKVGGAEPKGQPASRPPAPPRKKKKRSGRRR